MNRYRTRLAMQVLTGSQRFWFDSYTDALGEVLERIGVPGIKKNSSLAGYGGTTYTFSQALHQRSTGAAKSGIAEGRSGRPKEGEILAHGFR